MIIMIIIAVFNPTPETSPLITDGGGLPQGVSQNVLEYSTMGEATIPTIYRQARINVPPHAGGALYHPHYHPLA